MKSKGPVVLAVFLGLLSPAGHGTLQHYDGVSAPSLPGSFSLSLGEQMTRLTLGEAIFLGLRNNPSIRSGYLQRVAEKFDLQVAEDAFKPRLTLKSTYLNTRGSEDRTRNAELSPRADLLGEYGTRLSLGWTRQMNTSEQAARMRSDGLELAVIQPLLRGAGREVTTAPLRLARLSEQARRLNLKASVAQTVSGIITTYRDLLHAQEQLSIVEQALQRTHSLLEVNRALIRAGRMAEFDVVQTQADIAAQELGVEEAHNQLQRSRVALLRLLALDLSMPIQASEVLDASQTHIDRQQALQLAQVQQPEYLATLLQGQQAELNLVIAKDQSRWDLSLVAGANQRVDRHDTGATRRWDRYAGVQLEIPLGDRSVYQAEVQARVNQQTQEIALADARQALDAEVTTVVRELGTLWRQYEIARRSVDLSQRKLDIEREKLGAGRSSNFQVISFEGDLRNAQSARLGALIAYLNAQTRLELTLGMTLESWEIALNDD